MLKVFIQGEEVGFRGSRVAGFKASGLEFRVWGFRVQCAGFYC